MEKKVRMADIAQALNVSVVTVSKALSGREGVGEDMRRKIQSLARDMGYVPLRSKPQLQAQTQPAALSGNIGILVADRFFDDNTFYSSVYRQVLMCCNAHGYSALLDIVSWEAEHERIVPAMIQGRKVDGLIFMGEIDREYLKAMTQSGLPYILLDFYDDSINAPAVTSDNVTGGYRMTRHLLESGCREIGFIGSIHATSSIMDRFLGYTKALLEAGEPLRMEWVLEDRDQGGLYLPMHRLETMPRAFLCNCDQVAYNLVNWLKQEGYRVPEDVAVAGYDDHYYAHVCVPRLTTYRVNVEDMGRAAVRQLIDRIHGKDWEISNTILSGRFVKRQST